MVAIVPFRALRYDPDVAGPHTETSAPPYDELGRFDYATHREADPYTILELLTQEGAAAGGHDHARSTLERWQRTGVLALDDARGLWVYELHDTSDGHRQRGIVAALDLADVDRGRLLVHEDVDPARVAARRRRLAGVPVDLTPIKVVYLGAPPMVSGVRDAVCDGRPMIDLLDEQGIAHRLWPLTDSAAVESVARGLAGVTAVLADGHHRLAAAAQLADRGDGWRHTLAVLFDAEHLGPRLRAVHRLLHPSVTDPVGRLADIDGVTVVPREAEPDDPGMAIGELAGSLRRGTARRFGIVTDGQLWRVEVNDAIAQRRLAQHDVPAPLRLVDLVLAEEVLFPAMGLRQGAGEPVTEPERLAERLTGPQRGREVLLLLAPPTVGQVYAVAQAGLRMPPKSTWFAPKPRAGLLMRRPDLR